MTKLAKETAAVVENLPDEKAQEVLDFAHYLAEKADEEAWDRQFSDPRYEKKLREAGEAALRDLKEGRTTSLDPDKL